MSYNIRAIVTDIEGTTTPIEFVHKTLFPYARARMATFCKENTDDAEVSAALEAARELAGKPDLTPDETIELLISWIDEDKEAGPLKTLQGLIWRSGYEEGVLKGEVYEDAAAELHRWHQRGLLLFVYSSGSVAAQKLIFGYSDKGDLAQLFSGYFDTAIGGKLEQNSYAKIATETGFAPGEMLFLSDHPGEVEAAMGAGLQTMRIDRALAPDVVGEGPVAGSFRGVEQIFAPGA